MRFGAQITEQAGVAAKARRIEEMGYDVLTCGEHVSFHTPVTNAFVTLACAAGATERIRLMSSVALLPLYPAALAAKLGAALDVASGGRFDFGVGVGGEIPKEFEACGVPVKERGPRTNEALEVIRRLWTEEAVTHEGRFNTLNDVRIEPAPVQSPHPPIWVAGRQKGAARRAGRYADGWMPYMFTPEQFAESLAEVRSFAEEAGRDPAAIRAAIFIWMSVDADGDAARQQAIDHLSRNYNQDFTRLAPKYALSGSPEDCRARLREYLDAGADMAVVAPAREGDAAAEACLRTFAEEVAPAFR
jgi:probable F420-dependent oxidoreductase